MTKRKCQVSGVRKQKTEDREQITEERGQRTENRKQITDIGWPGFKNMPFGSTSIGSGLRERFLAEN